MSRSIVISRRFTGDVVSISLTVSEMYRQVGETYLAGRFGLAGAGIQSIVEDGDVSGTSASFDIVSGERFWHLNIGVSYSIVVRGDPMISAPEVVLISDSEDDGPSEQNRASVPIEDPHISELPELPQPVRVKDEMPGSSEPVPIVYQRSAMDSLLKATGTSELSRFIRAGNFRHEQVDCLPKDYNGNVVFELPPSPTLSKGARLRDMDRSKDCYIWTRILPTSANVQPRKLWEFGKVSCSGSTECRNNTCVYFQRKNVRNQKAWDGTPKLGGEHRVGSFIPEGGLVCHYCSQVPYCVSSCPAKLFYMYPQVLVDLETSSRMSRLAIHIGTHNHPSRKVFSRSAEKLVQEVIKRKLEGNPILTPAGVKNVATGSFVKSICESIDDIQELEETEIFDSLMVVSSPRKFASLFRSVRQDQAGRGELDFLVRFQRNINLPFLQRFLLPGQGSVEERPHIFKMTSKGAGSGVDLLRQMQPGGSLHGAWVSFDVMKRLTKDWFTFSAHVYDHNYRALCTLFTCELKAEDTESFERAWRLMIDVAKENGLENPSIHGFMADNAQAGWAAVQNVFWGGHPNPDRERSDAFHFYQAFHRHSTDGVLQEHQEEHLNLWNRMRNAPSFVEAYRMSREIDNWWQNGHCIPGKLRELQSWISWWVVRWRQWGTFIRLNKSAEEGAKIPNCTGSESMHAVMKAWVMKKKVGLFEACEMDQNRAVSQIGAYTAYKKGLNRGKGPTIWELAFRSADQAGSPKLYEDAMNMLLSNAAEFDLERSVPLNGDVTTKSQKRKGHASGRVSPQDSHRHDRILVTSPNTRSLRRKNLHVDLFQTMTGRLADDVPIVDLSDNDIAEESGDVELNTPPPQDRPLSPTNPGESPSLVEQQSANLSVLEIDVPATTWHLRRSSRFGAGPQCNGSSGLHSTRDECRNRVRKVGYPSSNGVVAIAVKGQRLFRGEPVSEMIWFCPNNTCYRTRPRRGVLNLPPFPDVLPVLKGTQASEDELHFLHERGLKLIRSNAGSVTPPSAFELRINVNLFPERVTLLHPNVRLRSRNGRNTVPRATLTKAHISRIESAQKETMSVLEQWDIPNGNAWGKQFRVQTQENLRTPKTYIVQICVFPSCSCPDFYQRHSRKMPYIPCKHLYWVFHTVFKLDVEGSTLTSQPILTVEEVRLILARQNVHDL